MMRAIANFDLRKAYTMLSRSPLAVDSMESELLRCSAEASALELCLRLDTYLARGCIVR